MEDLPLPYLQFRSVERIIRASTVESAVDAFAKAIEQLGAPYFGIAFIPRPGEGFENATIAARCRPDWRALYAAEKLHLKDPNVRFLRRTVLPYDWASAPYNPETEPEMKWFVNCARDFRVHKAISVPIPGPTGNIGQVWLGGPDFDDRDIHKPILHLLGLYVFHHLEKLVGRTRGQNLPLTDREREVLAWASDGKTSWEISCILNISQSTVEWYFRQAYRKLGVTNRLQAIAVMAASQAVPRQES